jgi:hypothetical protein
LPQKQTPTPYPSHTTMGGKTDEEIAAKKAAKKAAKQVRQLCMS